MKKFQKDGEGMEECDTFCKILAVYVRGMKLVGGVGGK